MIDFETDQANVLQKTDNIRSLSGSSRKIRNALKLEIELQAEENLKNTKERIMNIYQEK